MSTVRGPSLWMLTVRSNSTEEKNSPGNWTRCWDRLPIKMIRSWTRICFPPSTSGLRLLRAGCTHPTGSVACFYRLIFLFFECLICPPHADLSYTVFYAALCHVSTTPDNRADRKAILALILNKCQKSPKSPLTFFFFFNLSVKLHFSQMNWKRIMVRKGQRRDECVLKLHTDPFFP